MLPRIRFFFPHQLVRSLFLSCSFVLSRSLSSFRSHLFHVWRRAWARCHTRAGTGAENATDRASSCCSGSDPCNATAMRITRRIITAAPLSSRVAVPRLPTLVSSETCVLYRRRVPRLDATERCSRFCTPAKIMTGGIMGAGGRQGRERSGYCGSWFYEQSSFRSFFREDKGGI